MNIFTIGFTKKSAEQFFTRLEQPGLKRVVDTRLNNVAQLAGFTKKEDLRFFLREVGHIDYAYLPALAPTQDILDAYKKNGGDWATYAKQFLALMSARRVESTVDKALLAGACLLCTEAAPPIVTVALSRSIFGRSGGMSRFSTSDEPPRQNPERTGSDDFRWLVGKVGKISLRGCEKTGRGGPPWPPHAGGPTRADGAIGATTGGYPYGRGIGETVAVLQQLGLCYRA